MPFDGIVASCVVCELSEKLTDGKIEKIYQPEPDELVFNIHAGKSGLKLLISSNSSHARIHLTRSQRPNPQNPSAFCMLLRKHLSGGRIRSIGQKDSERIIEIKIDTLNEMGFSVSKRLVVEVMGKHSNIVLVDNMSGKIIDSIKRISIDVSRYRQLLPGLLYAYPPDQGKTCLFGMTREDFAAAFRIGDSGNANDDSTYDCDAAARLLSASIQGVSPALAQDLAARCVSYSEVTDAMLDLSENIRRCRFAPSVYLKPDGQPVDFHCFQLTSAAAYYEELSFHSVSEAIEYYFEHKSSSNRLRQKSGDMTRVLEASIAKLNLKKQKLSEDLLEARNADIFKLYGELITANIHQAAPKQASIDVLDYYDGSQRTIPLDPRLTAAQNAQRYYKRYAKARTAIREKNVQLEETDRDIAYLDSVLSHIENAGAVEDIDEIRQELIDGGFLKKRSSSGKPQRYKPAPIQRVSKDGFRILIGKNNRENDHLTFKAASAKDLWLHTKDIAGSHVIILTEGRSVPETTLFEAASLAAYYSKARLSGNVPVDYTLVKNVKKPAGAKPGMVIFVNNKTIYVNPSDSGRCK